MKLFIGNSPLGEETLVTVGVFASSGSFLHSFVRILVFVHFLINALNMSNLLFCFNFPAVSMHLYKAGYSEPLTPDVIRFFRCALELIGLRCEHYI